MAICNTATLTVTDITFNGTALRVVPKKTTFKVGGDIASGVITDIAGRASPIYEVMPSELKTSLILDGSFTLADLDKCGDLLLTTNNGQSFLSTNAFKFEDPEFNDDGGTIEVSFRGDVFKVY